MPNLNKDGGGVLLRVLIAGATLLLIAFAIMFVMSRYRDTESINLRKAMAISEYGLFQAMQKLGGEPSWRAGFDKTAYEQGWYTVVLVPQSLGDTLFLSVVSRGFFGSASDEKTVNLRVVVTDGDTVWGRLEK